MRAVIEVCGLTKDYGNRKGIFDLNFSIGKGEVYGYLGPNGAGKTTTIRHLMGFIRPDRGNARIEGMDCFRERERIQEKLGYLPGELALMEGMSGMEYLNFMADMKRIRNRNRIKELIDYFELNPKGAIRKMSKGTRQKLAIIAAFMQEPEILILDEPTSGLDPLMQNRFVDLVLDAKRKGATVLLSTHIFEEVEKTCDRTAILRNGSLVAVEDMKSLAGKKEKLYTVTFRDTETAAEFARGPVVVRERKGPRVVVAASGEPGELLMRIVAFHAIDLDIRTQSLEELFLHFYDKEAVR